MKARSLKLEDVNYKTEPFPWRSEHPTGVRVFASLKGLAAVCHTLWIRDRPYVEDAVKPLVMLELQKKLARHLSKVREYLE